MFDTLYSQIGAGVAILIVAFAFLKGDEPEKIGAGAFMIGWLASLLVQDDSALHGPQWGMMAIDLVCLAIYLALAWKSRRAWPAWASGLQSLAVASHLLILVDQRVPLSSFYTVIALAGYGILLALAIGTFWAWQERRAAGLE